MGKLTLYVVAVLGLSASLTSNAYEPIPGYGIKPTTKPKNRFFAAFDSCTFVISHFEDKNETAPKTGAAAPMTFACELDASSRQEVLNCKLLDEKEKEFASKSYLVGLRTPEMLEAFSGSGPLTFHMSTNRAYLVYLVAMDDRPAHRITKICTGVVATGEQLDANEKAKGKKQ
jgi:hypothetical protein